MEARNFVTAREMIEKGNWLVPTMNGELRIAKPPLPTWITAILGAWFGMESLSVLRFPSGVMASIMVAFMYLFSLSLNKNRISALTNSLILASSFYVLFMGRNGTWDIYCHSFMLGAIWLLHKAWKTEGNKWLTFMGIGTLWGLSFLSKGPVAFFATLIPFLIAYAWVYNGKMILKQWKPLALAVLIFAVISFWWPLFISLLHADEAAAIAKLESGSWMNRHVRPFYYYWNFPIQSGIWTLIIASALIFPYAFKRFEAKKEYKFALIWTLSAVVLLSVLPEKKDRYLLPVLIPSALLAGQFIQHLQQVFKNKTDQKWDRILFGINTSLIALVSFALPIVVYYFFYQDNQISLLMFILFSLLCEAVLLMTLYAWKNRNALNLVLGMVFLMILAEAFIIPNTASILNQNPDFKDIRGVRGIEAIKDLNLYSAGEEGFRIELVWEVGREVKEWNVIEAASLPEQQAFALFSSTPPTEILPENIQEQVNIKVLDFYDFNRYSKGKHRYKTYFKKYVSIISPKTHFDEEKDQ
jgi:4-amino-4-deoxy-L-arabinose transferase-like glycosyltransferase